MNRDLFLAYSAGLFDGEGCIHIAWQANDRLIYGGQYRLQVAVDQARRLSIFDEWVRTWGGAIYRQRTEMDALTNRPGHIWYWRVGDRAAAAFLRDIMPYLQRKKEEAELALQFESMRSARRGTVNRATLARQRDFCARLKALKHTGYEEAEESEELTEPILPLLALLPTGRE